MAELHELRAEVSRSRCARPTLMKLECKLRLEAGSLSTPSVPPAASSTTLPLSDPSAAINPCALQVAAAVQSWSAGGVDAAAFLARMAALGVQVHLAPEGLPALPAPQQIT